ncbi:hypothetical protein EJ06DRAFT_526990 [Trichodelitschia bisporula]|uniref:Secreted protein n=1 Tax=Trichodelitschia bisporula TaxID=703511 RepID=A0A6G1I533_9PEZI|nr:hypothetical protein EJ06DRAFT_526990 [Trichodelitschia bisporula]
MPPGAGVGRHVIVSSALDLLCVASCIASCATVLRAPRLCATVHRGVFIGWEGRGLVVV